MHALFRFGFENLTLNESPKKLSRIRRNGRAIYFVSSLTTFLFAIRSNEDVGSSAQVNSKAACSQRSKIAIARANQSCLFDECYSCIVKTKNRELVRKGCMRAKINAQSLSFVDVLRRWFHSSRLFWNEHSLTSNCLWKKKRQLNFFFSYLVLNFLPIFLCFSSLKIVWKILNGLIEKQASWISLFIRRFKSDFEKSSKNSKISMRCF